MVADAVFHHHAARYVFVGVQGNGVFGLRVSQCQSNKLDVTTVFESAIIDRRIVIAIAYGLIVLIDFVIANRRYGCALNVGLTILNVAQVHFHDRGIHRICGISADSGGFLTLGDDFSLIFLPAVEGTAFIGCVGKGQLLLANDPNSGLLICTLVFLDVVDESAAGSDDFGARYSGRNLAGEHAAVDLDLTADIAAEGAAFNGASAGHIAAEGAACDRAACVNSHIGLGGDVGNGGIGANGDLITVQGSVLEVLVAGDRNGGFALVTFLAVQPSPFTSSVPSGIVTLPSPSVGGTLWMDG